MEGKVDLGFSALAPAYGVFAFFLAVTGSTVRRAAPLHRKLTVRAWAALAFFGLAVAFSVLNARQAQLADAEAARTFAAALETQRRTIETERRAARAARKSAALAHEKRQTRVSAERTARVTADVQLDASQRRLAYLQTVMTDYARLTQQRHADLTSRLAQSEAQAKTQSDQANHLHEQLASLQDEVGVLKNVAADAEAEQKQASSQLSSAEQRAAKLERELSATANRLEAAKALVLARPVRPQWVAVDSESDDDQPDRGGSYATQATASKTQPLAASDARPVAETAAATALPPVPSANIVSQPAVEAAPVTSVTISDVPATEMGIENAAARASATPSVVTDAVSDIARAHIRFVINEDARARGRYNAARDLGRDPYDAIIVAYANDPNATAAITAFGAANTEAFIAELEP